MNILVAISTEQNIKTPSMGSERQMLGYCNALAGRGHTVYVANVLKDAPDWSVDYNLCHLINASGPNGAIVLTAQMCHEKNIPVFIAPVYWPTDEVEEVIIEKLEDYIPDANSIKKQFSMPLDGFCHALREADWLLPNAEIEMQEVVKLLGGGETTSYFTGEGQTGYTVIRNGVDVSGEIEPALALPDEDLVFDQALEDILAERFVLCVGRIEARKNQAAVIKAMELLWEEDPELQLVLMGEKSAPYVRYIKEEIKGKSILFCPPGPSSAVMMMMRRCSAHILASFIETPGLVNLEAAALNKPVIMAERGSVKEYFQNVPGAFYVDPKSPEDIAEKIRLALDFGPANELGSFVRETYSHEKIAADLESVYKRIIADKKA